MSAHGPASSSLHFVEPRARVIMHPGRPNDQRIQSHSATCARHLRLSLEPGATLADAVIVPLLQIGVTSASMTVLGGRFAELHYCLAPPDPTHQAVIAYTRPRNLGAALMIFGNATLATLPNGKPVVHCHAAVSASDGVHGGHIVPHLSVVGKEPISVLVTTWTGFDLQVRFDPETNIPLIQPTLVGRP